MCLGHLSRRETHDPIEEPRHFSRDVTGVTGCIGSLGIFEVRGNSVQECNPYQEGRYSTSRGTDKLEFPRLFVEGRKR